MHLKVMKLRFLLSCLAPSKWNGKARTKSHYKRKGCNTGVFPRENARIAAFPLIMRFGSGFAIPFAWSQTREEKPQLHHLEMHRYGVLLLSESRGVRL